MGRIPERGELTVFPDSIRIVPPEDYSGEGRSRGLVRGLLVYYCGANLVGEGMGVGSVAIRNNECTYFSRSCTDLTEGEYFTRTFTIDTRLNWKIRGNPSALLTRVSLSVVRIYMQLPWIQGIMLILSPRLHSMLGIEPFFEPVPSRGSVTLRYRISGHHVDIHVPGGVQVGPDETLCLLNELSAEWLTSGWEDRHQVPPPPGWKEVFPAELPVSLVDPFHRLRICIDKPVINPPVPYRIYQGRENAGDLCWAGFCIEVGPVQGSQKLPEIQVPA